MQQNFPAVPTSINLPLVVADVEIRQDAVGRFCLNDLHRASGGDAKHQPANWLRLDTTQALAKAVNSSHLRNQTKTDSYPKAGIPAIESKQGLGTFVVKQLVYAYAMWISAEFHLRVIDTFDAVVTGQYQPAPLTPELQLANAMLIAGRMIEEQKSKIEQRDKLISHLSPKAMIAEQLIMSDEAVNLTTAAKLFRLPPHKFNKALERIKWIYKRPGSKHWLGHQPKVIAGYIDHKEHLYTKDNGDTGTNPQVVITQKGLAKLALLLGKEPDVNALDSLVADHYADAGSDIYAEVV